MLKRIVNALRILFARNYWRTAYEIGTQDPLDAYYEELATPRAHMRELARKNIGLMSEMNGR